MDPNTFSYSMYAVSVFTSFINIPPIIILLVLFPLMFYFDINKDIIIISIIFLSAPNLLLWGFSFHANRPLINAFSPKYICNNKEYKCLNTETYSLLFIKISSIIYFIQTIIYIMLFIFIIQK
jgi:hypothetical protein